MFPLRMHSFRSKQSCLLISNSMFSEILASADNFDIAVIPNLLEIANIVRYQRYTYPFRSSRLPRCKAFRAKPTCHQSSSLGTSQCIGRSILVPCSLKFLYRRRVSRAGDKLLQNYSSHIETARKRLWVVSYKDVRVISDFSHFSEGGLAFRLPVRISYIICQASSK